MNGSLLVLAAHELPFRSRLSLLARTTFVQDQDMPLDRRPIEVQR